MLAIISPFARVKLCRLTFGSDGSLYVQFPYFGNKTGVVSELQLNQREGEEVPYDLGASGIDVLTDVKYSHHASGIVQFSKENQGFLPRRRSFCLKDGTGVLFMFFVYQLKGFRWVDEIKKKDLILPLRFIDRHPFEI